MGNPHGLDIEEYNGKHGKAQRKAKKASGTQLGRGGWVGQE